MSVQVFHKPSADSSRKFHALFRYTVLLLASTKTKTECVALFDTSFVLHVNLNFSPSFVKLSQFEKLKLKVCTWYQQVVHVRAQLQRSDGVSTVAYCLLNAEHGSLQSECFVHAHAVIFPTHEAACVYLLFQVFTHASNKHMSHMFPIYSNMLPPLLCTCSTRSSVFSFHRTALN